MRGAAVCIDSGPVKNVECFVSSRAVRIFVSHKLLMCMYERCGVYIRVPGTSHRCVLERCRCSTRTQNRIRYDDHLTHYFASTAFILVAVGCVSGPVVSRGEYYCSCLYWYFVTHATTTFSKSNNQNNTKSPPDLYGPEPPFLFSRTLFFAPCCHQ